MQFEAQDHYQTLGLAKNADQATIKRAYYKLIREYTPESNPAAFQRITEAYQTLSNPEKRRAYDAEERLPPEVDAEVDEILAENDDDPGIAAVLISSIADQYPESKKLRRLAGMLHLAAEEHDEACEVLEELCDLDPDDSQNLVLHGRALLGADRTDEAMQQFKSAIVADPNNSLAYLALSDHHMEEDEPEDALRILERGLMADNRLDAADYPLLQRILMIQAREHKWDAMNATADRINRLAPSDDPDARRFMASELSKLIEPYAEAERPDVLFLLMDLIVKLDPANSAAREHRDQLSSDATVYREMVQFLESPQAPDWIKSFVMCARIEKDDAERRKSLELVMTYASQRLPQCEAEWRRFRSSHPGLSASLQDFWENILRGARKLEALDQEFRQKVRDRLASTQAAQRQPQSTGCLGLLITCLLAAGALIVNLLLP